jgi:predicted transcriptional regulator
MEDELKADLKQIARGQKRSLAKHIEFVLEQYAAQEKNKEQNK